ncbi:acyltransferase [Candidatus Pelagibacter sp.]|nr:acyltransferase [Candidatus Pelagibacter sp.]
MKINYRPEIDGLRAIAVSAVIFYHAQLDIFDQKVFEGGFVGVDIFFVISGYLITSLILKELITTGKFSFRYFYERRARRILPALIVVILASLPAAWLFLVPGNFIEFTKSILYSLGFSSNFYFHYSGLQYGTEDGLLKPLLHTWSLSVEEQYYILFPIILLFIFKFFRKYLLGILLFGFLISLLMAEWGSRNYPAATFYFLHTRMWELIAGSLLAYFEIFKKKRTKNSFLNLIFPSVGIILIIHSIFFYNDKIFHPSLYTLSPVIGVSLIIWYSKKEELITKILSSRIFVGIGLISYSMYLWHYPIFAFARIKSDLPSQYDKFEWIVLTIFLSILSYFFIEKFFRNKKTNFFKILFIFLFSMTIISITLLLFYKNSNSFDFTKNIKRNIDNKKIFLENDHYKFRKSYSPKNFKNTPVNKKKVLIVGNSVGEDFFKIFYLNKELFSKYDFELISSKIRKRNSVYQVRCLGQLIRKNVTKCENFEFTKNILEQFEKSEIVILSTLWTEEDLIALDNLIPLIYSKNKKIILTNKSIYMNVYTANQFNPLDYYVYSNKKFPNKKKLKKLEKEVFKSLDQKKLNNILNDKAKKFGIQFLDMEEFQCNYKDKTCDLVTPDNYKIYWDRTHITEKGAKYLGNKIYELDWFMID